MSRTIKFAKAGGPEVLEFIETQVPAPGPREVRIKVKAIGIKLIEQGPPWSLFWRRLVDSFAASRRSASEWHRA